MPFQTTVGGKHGGCIGTRGRVHKQRRIAELARQSPEMGFTSLAHFIEIHWLREAYRRTRKDGAVGVDGQSGEDYAVDLEKHAPVAAGTSQIRYVPGASGASSPYPQRRIGDRDSAAGHSNLRG